MGAVCAKLCPWYNRRNSHSEDIEIELESRNVDGANPGYKLLHSQEEVPLGPDNLKIKSSNFVLKREGFPSEMYENLQELGSGTYGVVFKVKHKMSNNLRAMKIIKKEFVMEGVNSSEIEQEINILKNLDHPNILKVFEFFQDSENYYIITDLCEQGDLEYMLDNMHRLDEIVVKILMHQILSSVGYLHSHKVIHGDLKLQNILIESVNSSHRTSFKSSVRMDMHKFHQSSNSSKLNTGENLDSSNDIDFYLNNMSNYEIKLIDFGCSKIFGKGKSLSGIIGTPLYCSPEIIENKYNEKCDIWACGIIMYILLAGFPPFDGDTEEEIFRNIKKGNLDFKHKEFNNISDHALDLIKKLLDLNQDKRLSAKKAITHPFFKEINNQANSMKKKVDNKVLLSMKTIKSTIKFKQAVFAYISHNFANHEEVQKLRRLFKFLDKNNDGSISKSELLEGFREFGEDISNENLENIIKAIDNDGSGFIEYEEFIRANLDKERLLTDVNIKMAFDLFDIDKSGCISCEEMKQIIMGDRHVQLSVLSEFMSQINKSVDDVITYEDFKNLMLNDS
jgi:calcium-dependent protein kinase